MKVSEMMRKATGKLRTADYSATVSKGNLLASRGDAATKGAKLRIVVKDYSEFLSERGLTAQQLMKLLVTKPHNVVIHTAGIIDIIFGDPKADYSNPEGTPEETD